MRRGALAASALSLPAPGRFPRNKPVRTRSRLRTIRPVSVQSKFGSRTGRSSPAGVSLKRSGCRGQFAEYPHRCFPPARVHSEAGTGAPFQGLLESLYGRETSTQTAYFLFLFE